MDVAGGVVVGALVGVGEDVATGVAGGVSPGVAVEVGAGSGWAHAPATNTPRTTMRDIREIINMAWII